MRLLGHKSIKNTLGYTQLIDFPEDDEFVRKVAKTVHEASQLTESGFEYICTIDDTKLFRKRKYKIKPVKLSRGSIGFGQRAGDGLLS